MGSINSQISRSMGYISSGGNGFDAMAYGAGGMRGMETMAVASTALSVATTSLETISSFTPQGSAFKNARNIVNAFKGGKGNKNTGAYEGSNGGGANGGNVGGASSGGGEAF